MSDEFDPDELYEETDRETIARWIESVEEALDSGKKYPDKIVKFVSAIRTRFDTDEEDEHPLSGPQLVRLRTLYERS